MAVTPLKRRRRIRLTPYLFVAPAAIYLLVLMGYPLFEGLRLSLTDTSLLRPNDGNYIGADNYRELLASSKFYRTLWITLIYTVVCVVGAVGAGLLAALAMNRLTGRSRALRGLVIIPWAMPIIPIALITTWMLDTQYGVVNWALNSVGILDSNISWLNNENTALPAILVVTIWRAFPFAALVILAALQGVPEELFEAAKVDGAKSLSRFRHVTLPNIAPTLAILILFVTIWSLRRFDLIWVLTEGGPLGSTTTLVIDLYHSAFKVTELGMGSAIGVFGFAISTVLTAIYFIIQSRSAAAGRRVADDR